MMPGRIRAIDFARGAAIALMVLFNYSVTLGYFGLIRPPSGFAYSFALPALIAATFIFLSGVVARVASEKQGEDFGGKYFARGLKLLAFAALVTIFTYAFVPQGAIVFGILHFFAATSFLVPFLAKHKRANLALGLAAIAAGILLQQARFDFPYLLWLGFVPTNFSTFDYFPLLPWAGVLMLGMHLGKRVVRKAAAVKIGGAMAGVFEFLGRHSLEVYLVHQPLLVILLAALGFKTF
jgi:uncharacterized membrane protein